MLSRGAGLACLRHEQDIDQLAQRRVRAFVHFVEFYGSDGMLHHQHRMIGCAERFLFGVRQGVERVGDQRNREPAALLNLE